jgi:hypothetical protein
LGSIAALGILAFDQFALKPLLAQKESLESELARETDLQNKNRQTLKKVKENKARFQEMQKAGLRRNDAPEAESAVMRQVREWAGDAGVNLTLLQANRLERERGPQDKEKGFQRTAIRVTAAGGMAQISHFLWYIQTANIPIQFNDCAVTTHKEGTDDLTAQLTLSTIYQLPDTPQVDRPATAPQSQEVSE